MLTVTKVVKITRSIYNCHKNSYHQTFVCFFHCQFFCTLFGLRWTSPWFAEANKHKHNLFGRTLLNRPVSPPVCSVAWIQCILPENANTEPSASRAALCPSLLICSCKTMQESPDCTELVKTIWSTYCLRSYFNFGLLLGLSNQPRFASPNTNCCQLTACLTSPRTSRLYHRIYHLSEV